MGLLDYYRQFQDMDQEEVNKGLRERRRQEKLLALEEVPVLDLSSTEWPEFPNAEVVNASIYVARGRVNGYPDRHAARIRRALGERHGVEPERIAVGNGASELLQATAFTLLGPGDELLMPWPSYPLFPLMAQRAGARPVPVDLSGGRVDVPALLGSLSERTRAVVICNPNDPTGTWMAPEAVAELAERLPEEVHLLLDEAYADFVTSGDPDGCIRLTDRHPRILVFRTFSKAWGLSGLRAGYAVGAPGAGQLLEAIVPALGVNALTQAAVEQALKIGGREIERRVRAVAAQQERIATELHDLPVDAPRGEANFVWLRAAGLTGAELAGRLEREKVIVAPGAALGDDDHVRAAVRDDASTNRLMHALRKGLGLG